MTQQEFWNNKFNQEAYFYGKEPNSFLASYIHHFPKESKLLFLGEGEGRNAVFFAKEGYDVVATDVSDVGLKKLNTFAKKEAVDIQTIHQDLNQWEPHKKYDGILASYLHLESPLREEVFTKVEASLQSRGFFIAEFFSKKQLNYQSGGPKDENLLYSVDSFRGLFKSCIIHKLIEEEIELDEGQGHQGEACVIRLVVEKL